VSGLRISFQDGTLALDGWERGAAALPSLVVWDERVGRHRAKAVHYAEILRYLHTQKMGYQDDARRYQELTLLERAPRELRAYQQQALDAWIAARKRGVVVLPTGAGKSYVALRAILAAARSTVILAPTIELVEQWVKDLRTRLGIEIGQYGGGEKRLLEVTVATYDSAALFMPFYGDRFGMLICDECHHLPAAVNSIAAECCVAPFRLGLSATPERLDHGHERLWELIGPEIHRSHIHELEGNFLANYQVEVIEVTLDADEQEAYQHHRRDYLAFARKAAVDFGAADGWSRFIAAASRDPEGRHALRSYREQRRLARSSRSKLRALWGLVREHPGERMLIFTDDNETAYTIGRSLVLPVLTHHTRPAERRWMMESFRGGSVPVLVTSRVLNEGIDVPEAAIGVVVSGSGSVREHVQRLGRILRPGDGKLAMLYEMVSAGTAEAYTSERRSRHAAFGHEEPPWEEA
jgi:superfamily II DNA or RNA helicase